MCIRDSSERLAARQLLKQAEGRLSALDNVLRTAELLTPPDDGRIGCGHAVTLRQTRTGAVLTVILVTEAETVSLGNAEENIGLVGTHTRLGQALLGRETGDTVTIQVRGHGDWRVSFQIQQVTVPAAKRTI